MTDKNNSHNIKHVLEIPIEAEGILISRPSRFLGIVDIIAPIWLKGEQVHIHDPGRLSDILFPGNYVLLKKASGKKRKTKWDLIAGKAEDSWVLIHSGFHRRISMWVIENKIIDGLEDVKSILPEQICGNSRLDYLLEANGLKIWVEVKGCTLAKNGRAVFPDAPTKRGKKHVEELIKAVHNKDKAVMIVLVFRENTHCFWNHEEIDPGFTAAFIRALKKGVQVHPLVFTFERKGYSGNIYYNKKLPLCQNLI